jgi:Na/Pi-cotransporter
MRTVWNNASFSLFSAALLLSFVLVGCGPVSQEEVPDKIVLISPETQLGQAGATQKNGVHVELLSKPTRGLCGGSGAPSPLIGKKVRVVAVDPSCGIRATPDAGTTDQGGSFVCDVTLGSAFGDQYLEVVCEEAPKIRQRVRFVAGVTAENERQEVAAGDTLPKPIRIHVTAPDGAPVADSPVYFSLSRQPGTHGTIDKHFAQTDTNGMAEVSLTTDPDATGIYAVSAEVADPKKGFSTRSFIIEAMAMSTYGVIVSIFCGIALFIYGMTLLSEGLQQIAGNKMKTALSYITKHRVTGILAGAVVTALVQSSSAITVMTVGFVNAGLLTLRQAIGVVFGANIGTTVTGQIISFNLECISLPAIVAGVIGILIFRKGLWHGFFRTVLGFGLLFYGMILMSSELKSAGAFPSFVHFFQTFDCRPQPGQPVPLGAVLGAIGIGTLTTMVVQSSAATIGLAIALANSGLLNFWTAFPIILGDNIGTTITAILAAINTNRTAQQTAAAHSMFNVLGTCIMVLLLYVPFHGIPCFLYFVDYATAGNAFQGENLGRHIAMAHTFFNVTNVIVLTAFIPQLAWLCEHILPSKKLDARDNLEKHLLNTPSLALICATNALADMTEKAWRSSLDALTGYKNGKPVSVDAIHELENEVDRMQASIMNYLVQLTRRELTEKQAQSIPVLMHCVNDAERISDLAYLIARRAAGQPTPTARFTDDALSEMERLLEKASQIADLTLESLRGGTGVAKAVAIVMQDMKAQSRKSIQGHVDRLQRGLCKPERGMVYVEIISALENIVRHLENIAQRSDQLANA